jgi:multisubunit Na+/H+ antiporter MnhG subunit
MNHLRKLGLASFFFLGLGYLSGALGLSDPRWTRQIELTVTVTCYAIGLILALIAFMQSRRGQSLDGTTKFLARTPLALVTIGVLIFFLRAMTGLW